MSKYMTRYEAKAHIIRTRIVAVCIWIGLSLLVPIFIGSVVDAAFHYDFAFIAALVSGFGIGFYSYDKVKQWFRNETAEARKLVYGESR